MYNLTLFNYIIIALLLLLISAAAVGLFTIIAGYTNKQRRRDRFLLLQKKRRHKALQAYNRLVLMHGFQKDCRCQQALRNYIVGTYN